MQIAHTMARLQKHRRSKALPSARKSSRLRDPLRRAVSGPKRILRYLFGSRKKRYSWTLFQISTAEPFFITPTSPESMQIQLDLDGEGGISGNTRGSHSPYRGIEGLQVRNRRSVIVSGSTVGSLSFTPKTFRVGDSPGGGRRNDSDGSPGLNGFASGDGHRAHSDAGNDSDNDSGKDLWLLTYKYLRNQNRAASRKERVSIASSTSSSKDTTSSDGYRADFDLEADPWLLTYNFLDSINDQDSALQPKPVHKEPKTTRHGRSLRRKNNNADMRSQWAQHKDDDDVGMPPLPYSSPNNAPQIPTPPPPTQHPPPSNQPPPSTMPIANSLPTKYFPSPTTHLSHQGSGSRYPPPNLRIGIPAAETPLPDPEPPTPAPTMQNFEAAPVSDGMGESGVLVDWDEDPPPPQPTAPSHPPSPPPNLTTFTFPFEISQSPSLEEKIDEEYEAALGRWSGDVLAKRVRRSRDVRECMRRLRECTEFEGGLGWGV